MTDPLELLRARFIDRCRSDLEQLRGLAPDHPDVGPIAHRLAGSAGSFGYPEISQAAGVVDDRARYGPTPSPEIVQVLIGALEKATECPHCGSALMSPPGAGDLGKGRA